MIYAMTIAGFDGSAGAGILADVKAMKDFGVYATAVCTALTVQNEQSFSSPGFLSWERIREQLEKLWEMRPYKFFKIGLVQNAEMLRKIVFWIREKKEDACIVWDPILSATTGFRFFADGSSDSFWPLLSQIDLVTPNSSEFTYLGFRVDECLELSAAGRTSVLFKGGHLTGGESVDTLFFGGKEYKFASERLEHVDKHGSGCVLSSAILANLARGKSLPEACEAAKLYIQKFLSGGEGRVGWVENF